MLPLFWLMNVFCVSITVLNVKTMLMLKIPAVIAVMAEMVTVMIIKAY